MVPDLSLWRRAVAILVLACTALLILSLSCEAPPSQAFHDFNLERLRAFQSEYEPRQPHTLRLVLLGSSRLKNAVMVREVFDQVGRENGFGRIELFHLVANWAVFTNFEPLLDEVRLLRPDAYVIQMDLLRESMSPLYRASISFNYLRWLASGTGPWSWFEPQTEQLEQACTEDQTAEKRAKRATARLVVDAESASARRAKDFIRTVAAEGIRVVLVTVPKASPLEQALPSVTEDMLTSARDLSKELPQIIVSPYTAHLTDDQFCDVAHMNSSGARVYSRWLLEQIISVDT
jgi:hypothetical protein